MENQTPTPAALREALAALWNDIAAIEASRRGEAAWRQAYNRCQGIIESLPLDPGEAPAPAGDQTEAPSPQGLGEARTPREEVQKLRLRLIQRIEENSDLLVKLQGLEEAAAAFVQAFDTPLKFGANTTFDQAMTRWFEQASETRNRLKKALEARSAPPSSEGSPSSSPSVPPAPAPKGEVLGFGKTNRGFAHATFEDTYGHRCSIQKSSLATEDCIWLGSDEPPRRHLGDWLSSRMHLSRETVASLLPALHHFVATGDLPAPESPQGSVSEANRPNPNSNPDVTPSAAPQGQEESK